MHTYCEADKILYSHWYSADYLTKQPCSNMVGFRTHESWFSLLTIYTVVVSVTSLCKQLCVHVGELTIIHTEQKQTDHTHTQILSNIKDVLFIVLSLSYSGKAQSCCLSFLCVCVCVCVCVWYTSHSWWV